MDFAPGTFQGLMPREIEAVISLMPSMEGLGVEIGCCDGFSTAYILKHSRLFLVSVDPLIPDSMERSLIGNEERLLYNTTPYRLRWQWLKETSRDAFMHWMEPIDFLFLDGDHKLEAVRWDFDNWTKHLRRGGWLAMHDSRVSRGGPRFHDGPSQVADDCVYSRPADWHIICEVDSLTIAEKLK